MPTNRRRRSHARADVLNPNQEGFLRCGFDVFPGFPGFDSEEHEREAWAANRDRLMAENCLPGERPWAYWKYDLKLEETPDGFAWPEPIGSEQEMVYDLLKRGRLKSCRFNGVVAIESELREIRESWLQEIRLEVSFKAAVPKRTAALPTWGCPVWFYEQNAEAVLAKMQSEREAFYRGQQRRNVAP